MGKHTHRLTDAVVRKATKPGLHNDGDGLNLKITNSGSKSWIFRFKVNKRPFSMGFGAYPAVSVAQARKDAAEARAKLREGLNPIEERRAAIAAAAPKKAVTFQEAADAYIAAHESGWRNEKHRYQWRQTLTDYAGPFIGHMEVAEVGTDDILRVLAPIWTSKAETATRLRGRIENVLDWARVRGLREGENPAAWRGNLKHLLPTRNRRQTVKHHAAMPWQEVPEFMTELRANSAISARALEWTILTAARTSETIGALWPELDLSGNVWAVPGERMKMGLLHRVPLTKPALALLDDLPRIEGNPYVFPGARKGRPLSDMAMLEMLRGMHPRLTVHGFRSSFRDWAAENTNFAREVAEMALAHSIDDSVEAAYRRGDLFEKRRRLMEAWAGYCLRGTAEGKVVSMAVARNTA